jgi:transcriptional regulator with XRE-family HTH domain
VNSLTSIPAWYGFRNGIYHNGIHVSRLSGKEIGRRIRRIRGSLSQAEFARKIGVPNQNGVSRYEGGRIPTPALLVRIARAGRVSIDWILTGRTFGGSSLAAEKNPPYRTAKTRPERLPGSEALTARQREALLHLIRVLTTKNR